MFFIIGFILHSIAIYIGSSIAQLEHVDIWRSALIALLSYVVMLIIAIPVFLLLSVVPVVRVLAGGVIILLATWVAAKVVLSLDWKQAFPIALTAAVVSLLAGWVFSGCE
jgi:hypothetical protein